MPYLAIVYVPDDMTAEAIRERHSMTTTEGRLVALHEWPRKEDLTCRGFCNDGKLSPWIRAPKGYIVCGICGGRHVHTRRRLLAAIRQYLGVNMLPRDKTPGAFVNPEGWDL